MLAGSAALRAVPPAAQWNARQPRRAPLVAVRSRQRAIGAPRQGALRTVRVFAQGDGMPTEREVEPPLSTPKAPPPVRVRTVRKDGPKPWAPGESPVSKRNLIIAGIASIVAFAIITPATMNTLTPGRELLRPILDLPNYEILPSKDGYILSDEAGNGVMVGKDPMGNRLAIQRNGDVFVANDNPGALPPGMYLGNVRDLPNSREEAAEKLRALLGPS